MEFAEIAASLDAVWERKLRGNVLPYRRSNSGTISAPPTKFLKNCWPRRSKISSPAISKNPHSIEHGIEIRTIQALKRSLSPAERKQWLAFSNAPKIHLEQSEWRHERFCPELDGVPQSRYFLSQHALQPTLET